MSTATVVVQDNLGPATHEPRSRPDFRERVAMLAGGTTFREPVGGRSTDSGHMPAAHLVAAALGMARHGPEDIGPDIAIALALGSDHKRGVIVSKLALAMKGGNHRAVRRNRARMALVATAAFELLAHGQHRQKPAGFDSDDWGTLLPAACRILEALADAALWEAEAKWRGA